MRFAYRSLVLTMTLFLSLTIFLGCSPDQTLRGQLPPPGSNVQESPKEDAQTIREKIRESLRTRQETRTPEQTAIANQPTPTPTPLTPERSTPLPIQPAATKAPVSQAPTTRSPQPTRVPLPPEVPGPKATQVMPKPTEPPPSPTKPQPEPTPPQPTVRNSENALNAVYNLPWISDGATPGEKETIRHLSELARYNPDLALRLVDMPFLQTHEPRDTGAVGALNYLDYNNPQDALRVLEHFEPFGGITNTDTHRVALAYTQSLFGRTPTQILTREDIWAHTRSIQLPITGRINITVVTQHSRDVHPTLDRIQNALQDLEEYLQVPLPTHNVLIHYGGALPQSARSANTFISISQEAGHDAPNQFHWTLHELVHYWFNSNEEWLDEGMAQALTSIIQADGEPPTLPTTSTSCSDTARITHILKVTLDPIGVSSSCTYALGERFMQTLYKEAGHKEFRQGTGILAEIGSNPPERRMGIDELQRAFSAEPHAVQQARAQWYDTQD